MPSDDPRADLMSGLHFGSPDDIEMLTDIQAFDAAESRNEEAFPAELGAKLTDAQRAGKSLVPVWR